MGVVSRSWTTRAGVATTALFAVSALAAVAVVPAVASPRIALSVAGAEPGDRVVVAGHRFTERARARIALGARTMRRARTGPRGGFRLAFVVPNRSAGLYRVKAFVGGRSVRRPFRIRPVPDPLKLVAAGDVACEPGQPETATTCRQAHTADLVESLAPDAVAVLGDAQYMSGGLEDFLTVYDPTWGRFKAITHPAVGNHEYDGVPERNAAAGYFAYFGAAAGDPARGYYSWELGNWTMLVLNSGNIRHTRVGADGGAALPNDCWPVSCAKGSAQELWLRGELERLRSDACVLAYWHHPRFSSGYGSAPQPHRETGPMFRALYEHGAELVLSAHAHNYERFEPRSPGGRPHERGVTQFVVGTGGKSLHADTAAPQTPTLRTDVFGVLELSLGHTGWRSRFVAEGGSTVDAARGDCD